MINIPQELNFINAVLGSDLINQIVMLYQEDPALGMELALAAIVFIGTGGKNMVTDKKLLQVILEGSRSFVEKNSSRYLEKQTALENKEIKDKRLDEIAALLRDKVSQANIGRRLNMPPSTVSDRCKKIREKYPYLLADVSENIS